MEAKSLVKDFVSEADSLSQELSDLLVCAQCEKQTEDLLPSSSCIHFLCKPCYKRSHSIRIYTCPRCLEDIGTPPDSPGIIELMKINIQAMKFLSEVKKTMQKLSDPIRVPQMKPNFESETEDTSAIH